MIEFQTKNSHYEVDIDGKKIRRLRGLHDPFPMGVPDGEWRSFIEISEICLRQSVLVVWNEEGSITRTSPVQSYIEMPT